MSYTASANHVSPDVERCRQQGDGFEKSVVPFPPREGGDQTDPNDALAGRGKTRSIVEIELHAIRREALEVDGIPDDADRRQRPAQRPQIVGDASGRSNDRRTGARTTFQRDCAQRPPGDVVVNVPDERRSRRSGPRAEQVHLQPVGVDDLRREIADDIAEPTQVAPRRPGGPCAACRHLQTWPAAIPPVPFAKPCEGLRERQHLHHGAQRAHARNERAIGGHDHAEAPRRARLGQAGDDFEQRGLRAAHLASRVQEQNLHSSRCRTMIVSLAWTLSVGLASNSFLSRRIRTRLSEPRSVSPPASEMAWSTVKLGSRL